MSDDSVECPSCGRGVYRTATKCPNCNHAMENPVPIETVVAEAYASGPTRYYGARPDGTAHIAIGVIFGVLAIVLAVAAILAPDASRTYAWEEMQPNLNRIRLGWLSAAFWSLAVICWAIGQIVKAISFVGRED